MSPIWVSKVYFLWYFVQALLCCYKASVITKLFLSHLHVCTPENLGSFSISVCSHMNRRITRSEMREPEAADGVMQTHRVLVGDQMPRGPSGLLDCSGSSLISPAQIGRDLLVFNVEKCLFSLKFVFFCWVVKTAKRYFWYFHTCSRYPAGLTFLFTCVSSSWHSRSERTCERAFIVGEEWKTLLPHPLLSFIIFLLLPTSSIIFHWLQW